MSYPIVVCYQEGTRMNSLRNDLNQSEVYTLIPFQTSYLIVSVGTFQSSRLDRIPACCYLNEESLRLALGERYQPTLYKSYATEVEFYDLSQYPPWIASRLTQPLEY